MKKLHFLFIMVFILGAMLPGCGARNEIADSSRPSGTLDTNALETKITEEMAYEGVYNYCRSVYDWTVVEDNPDIMWLEIGEETESGYQVIFRSYTGAFVYFYVDKSSGTTKLTEYVPSLDMKEDAGTIDLYDYLK